MKTNETNAKIFKSHQEGQKVICNPDSTHSTLGETTFSKIVLTKTQFDNYIACLNDITSKSKKVKQIINQKAIYQGMRKILNEYCINSNGGRIPTEINQYVLRNKRGISKNTLIKIIKNLLHYEIIKIHTEASFGKNATFYIGGNLLLELLDPKLAKKKNTLKHIEKKRHYFTSLGHNPDTMKTCDCCRNAKRLIYFNIHDESNRIVPVCNSCENERKTGTMPAGYKAAWRSFFTEIKNDLHKDLTEYEKDEMEDIGLEAQTERLLEEYSN